ncbi:hypothetical protein NMY22_g12202 [Coprinellus aureogranulatus]|nr:hypothetical protein NMY22_g12202 [Coprinellus aureogranulatus]
MSYVKSTLAEASPRYVPCASDFVARPSRAHRPVARRRNRHDPPQIKKIIFLSHRKYTKAPADLCRPGNHLSPSDPQATMARAAPSRPSTTGLKRKAPLSSRLPNIKITLPQDLSIDEIQKQLKRKLKLKFLPDKWQAHLIQRILQGYDSVLCAGTGYGKSLIFEGLAKLGGAGKVVVVICPLKALERDQAFQASKKGIHTVVLNEDTTKSQGLWERAKTKASIIYCSPEMALAPRFLKLWTDVNFRKRLTAVIVDEAHCIEDWGGDDFRPQYMELESLRSFTGQDVPFLACTATCMTSTFDLLWKTLQFGYRPFWGLDVGVDRPNLFFQVQGIENTNYPLLDILNIFPQDLSDTTKREDLPKAILYFDTEAKCREAVQFLRKILPEHLRNAVHAFSSTLSEDGKATNWDDFMNNLTRLLCATDAAGMGCNVTDIKFVISIGIPKSVGQAYQRWGRAGRDRVQEAMCIQLIPPWARYGFGDEANTSRRPHMNGASSMYKLTSFPGVNISSNACWVSSFVFIFRALFLMIRSLSSKAISLAQG